MSGKLAGIFGLMAALSGPAHADWKITTVVRGPQGESTQTEYFKGKLRRTDWREDVLGHHRESVIVLDFERRRQTAWKPGQREYAVVRLRPAPIVPAATVEVVIDRATIDTGERRQFFGRAARHLVTHETSRGGPADWNAVVDGWYIESDTLPAERRGTVVHMLIAGSARPHITVNQTGPKPSGLAVWEKRTSGGDERITEVTELVEAPLPDDVFLPPAGYKRVVSLADESPVAWSDRLLLEWERFEDWIAGMFN